METILMKKEKEQATQVAAPIVDTLPVETCEEVAVVEQSFPLDKRSPRKAGRPTNEERSDIDMQRKEIHLISGMLLHHFKMAVQRGELDFNQELKLFSAIKDFLPFEQEGNKNSKDIGMDAFALKYLEVNTHIKSVSGKLSSKS